MKLLPLLSDGTVRLCAAYAPGFVSSIGVLKALWSLTLDRSVTEEEANYILARSAELFYLDHPDQRPPYDWWASLERNEADPNFNPWRTIV